MTNNYNLKPQSEIKDFSDRIIELEELFRRTNDDIFAVHAKRIDLPVFVTIQSRGKRRAYGWCYIVPNWVNTWTKWNSKQANL